MVSSRESKGSTCICAICGIVQAGRLQATAAHHPAIAGSADVHERMDGLSCGWRSAICVLPEQDNNFPHQHTVRLSTGIFASSAAEATDNAKARIVVSGIPIRGCTKKPVNPNWPRINSQSGWIK